MSAYEGDRAERPAGRKWSVKEFVFKLATDRALQEEFLYDYRNRDEDGRRGFLEEFLEPEHAHFVLDVKIRWTIQADVKLREDAPPDVDPKVEVSSFFPTW